MSAITTAEINNLFPHQKDESVADLGRQYVSLRREIEAAEAGLSVLKERRDQAEAALIAKLDAQGVKSIKLTGVGDDVADVMLTATTKTDYRLPPEEKSADRERVLLWLKRCHAGALIKEEIHWARFQSWCCERRDTDKPIAAEVVQFERRAISMRKG